MSADLGRVDAVPAFADGRHDLRDPSVKGVEFFRLGRAGSERTPVTRDACPPDPFDGPGRGAVGQREPASIDRIARMARVARPTIYQVFGSRAGLFEAAGADLLERGGFGRMLQAAAHPDAREAVLNGAA